MDIFVIDNTCNMTNWDKLCRRWGQHLMAMFVDYALWTLYHIMMQHAYIHTYAHTQTHIQTERQTYAYIPKINTYIHTHVHTHIQTCTHIYTHLHLHIHIHIHLYTVYIYIYCSSTFCIYIHTYIYPQQKLNEKDRLDAWTPGLIFSSSLASHLHLNEHQASKMIGIHVHELKQRLKVKHGTGPKLQKDPKMASFKTGNVWLPDVWPKIFSCHCSVYAINWDSRLV